MGDGKQFLGRQSVERQEKFCAMKLGIENNETMNFDGGFLLVKVVSSQHGAGWSIIENVAVNQELREETTNKL
jgi:hypothetical protein